MSEELIQRNLIEAPEKMGDWNFYNIGATTLKALKGAKIIPDCDVTRSVSKMTEIERRGGKRWDKPKKAEKSRDCGGGKF